jgi:RNA-directed DNA polymerase
VGEDSVATRKAASTSDGELLANVLLDEVDKELEKREHTFVRYADDCNVYVQSRRAGEHVMELLRRLYAKLRLRVNETKSAVDLATKRKILGYSFLGGRGTGREAPGGGQSPGDDDEQVRFITKRTRGRSIEQVCDQLRGYLLGWKEYFRLADTPRIFADLDEWIRHRL